MREKQSSRSEPRVTLKTVADHLGLTPGTVSATLNNSPAARSIPEQPILRCLDDMRRLTRGVEGFITTDTSLNEKVALPAVAISGHRHVEGVTNIVLDHKRAARLALEHLKSLGHERLCRQLLVHCCRMLGSVTDAEDAVQETLLRAGIATA